MGKPDFSKKGSLKEQFDRYDLFDQAGLFTSRQGHKIRYGIAKAADGVEKKGTKVFTSGYGQYIDLHGRTIKQYQDEGWDVYAMDWHNHGLSGRDRPDDPSEPCTRGMARHVSDLHDFMTQIVQHDPESGPLVLSTFSMGGHIGMLYLQEHPEVFDAALMGAPLFDIYRMDMPSWARPAVRGLFNGLSNLGLGSSPMPHLKELSQDLGQAAIRVKKAFKPSLSKNERQQIAHKWSLGKASLKNPSPDWIRATFPTTDTLMDPANLAKVKIPVLIGTAQNDDLVDKSAHKTALKSLKQGQQVFLDSPHNILPCGTPGQKATDNLWLTHGRRFTDEIIATYKAQKSSGLNEGPLTSAKKIPPGEQAPPSSSPTAP